MVGKFKKKRITIEPVSGKKKEVSNQEVSLVNFTSVLQVLLHLPKEK